MKAARGLAELGAAAVRRAHMPANLERRVRICLHPDRRRSWSRPAGDWRISREPACSVITPECSAVMIRVVPKWPYGPGDLMRFPIGSGPVPGVFCRSTDCLWPSAAPSSAIDRRRGHGAAHRRSRRSPRAPRPGSASAGSPKCGPERALPRRRTRAPATTTGSGSTATIFGAGPVIGGLAGKPRCAALRSAAPAAATTRSSLDP